MVIDSLRSTCMCVCRCTLAAMLLLGRIVPAGLPSTPANDGSTCADADVTYLAGQRRCCHRHPRPRHTGSWTCKHGHDYSDMQGHAHKMISGGTSAGCSCASSAFDCCVGSAPAARGCAAVRCSGYNEQSSSASSLGPKSRLHNSRGNLASMNCGVCTAAAATALSSDLSQSLGGRQLLTALAGNQSCFCATAAGSIASLEPLKGRVPLRFFIRRSSIALNARCISSILRLLNSAARPNARRLASSAACTLDWHCHIWLYVLVQSFQKLAGV
jgi:hypothetical protein